MTESGSLIGHGGRHTAAERDSAALLVGEYEQSPIPPDEKLGQAGLFQNHIALGRTLWLAHLYMQIVDVPGAICVFGVRWGQDMATFGHLRALHEPYNHLRRVIGFDTFVGFPHISAEDGETPYARPGNYAVTDGYEARLGRILDAHEAAQPIPQIRKHDLVKGDAVETVPAYIEANPSLVVSLAYFDFDLYQPTRRALEAIAPRLARGAIVAFDQFAHPHWPGETLACLDVLELRSLRLRRLPFLPNPAYFVVE